MCVLHVLARMNVCFLCASMCACACIYVSCLVIVIDAQQSTKQKLRELHVMRIGLVPMRSVNGVRRAGERALCVI